MRTAPETKAKRCRHESVHAVLPAFIGHPEELEFVTADSTHLAVQAIGYAGGLTRYRTPDIDCRYRDVLQYYRRQVLYALGAYALDGSGGNLTFADRSTSRWPLSWEEARKDTTEGLASLIIKGAVSEETYGKLVEAFWGIARDPQFRQAVDRVALALIDAEQLTGDEVYALVADLVPDPDDEPLFGPRIEFWSEI